MEKLGFVSLSGAIERDVPPPSALQPCVVDPGAGDVCVTSRSNRRIAKRGSDRAGNTNPGVADISKLPRLTGIALFPTATFWSTPTKLTVAWLGFLWDGRELDGANAAPGCRPRSSAKISDRDADALRRAGRRADLTRAVP
jgi:hypothetical protein